tara:strand:+ start:71 stop:490 length:420 start_codon:yes stop_codon:yes gene_type:complete
MPPKLSDHPVIQANIAWLREEGTHAARELLDEALHSYLSGIIPDKKCIICRQAEGWEFDSLEIKQPADPPDEKGHSLMEHLAYSSAVFINYRCLNCGHLFTVTSYNALALPSEKLALAIVSILSFDLEEAERKMEEDDA